MPTTNKGLEQPAASSTNWDVPLNANFGYIDSALGGTTTKSVTGIGPTPVVLTAAEYRNLGLSFSGTLTANVTYQIPSGVGGQWVVSNGTTGPYTLSIGMTGYPFTIQIPQGSKRTVYSTTTGIDFAETNTGTVTSVAVSGGTTGLTTSGGPITSSGTITIGGTLGVSNGGTGATSAAAARTNLGAQANLGFTPVQQGGGTSMGTNKVYVGWNGIGLFAQVDTTSLGRIVVNADATGATGTYSSTQLFAPGNAPLFAARAWVNFYGGTGGIRRSGNVSSITRFGVGSYTVNFSTAMSDSNYAGCAMFYSPSTSTYPYAPVYNGVGTGGFAFQCITASIGLFDPDIVNFVAFS